MKGKKETTSTSQATQDASQPKTLKEFIDKTSNLLAALAVFVSIAGYMITIPDRILGMVAATGASISAALIVRELWNELPAKKLSDWRLVQFKRVIIFTLIAILLWGHLRYYIYLRDLLWFEMAVVIFSFMVAKDALIQKWLRPDHKLKISSAIVFFVGMMTSILVIPFLLRKALDFIASISDYVKISGLVIASLLSFYCLGVLITLVMGRYPLDEGT
jgi:hypothetical protein